MNETRSARVILDDAIAKEGWNDATVVDLLIDYIQEQGDNARFADFLAERSSE